MKVAAALELVGAHLRGPVSAEAHVLHVEYDAEVPRWYLRFRCDGRDASTIYLDFRQRSLRYEVYFLPNPPPDAATPARHEDLYRYLLRRNHQPVYDARFSVGPDGDVYLVGRLPYEHLSVESLDRLIGTCYEMVENWFQPAVELAYAKPSPLPEKG